MKIPTFLFSVLIHCVLLQLDNKNFCIMFFPFHVIKLLPRTYLATCSFIVHVLVFICKFCIGAIPSCIVPLCIIFLQWIFLSKSWRKYLNLVWWLVAHLSCFEKKKKKNHKTRNYNFTNLKLIFPRTKEKYIPNLILRGGNVLIPSAFMQISMFSLLLFYWQS